MTHFDFAFATPYRIAGVPFAITPSTTGVEVDDQELRVRFGPWKLVTSLDNVEQCQETGPYQFVKTAGPAHLSLGDKGLTCATNGDRGLCIRFADPVPGIDPWGRILHPAVTVTVADPSRLAAELRPAGERA